MKQYAGYTMLELLFGIVLFSALLGTVFSVFSTLRTAEKFRDDNAKITQAANYSFEPMVRAIKQADAQITIKDENGICNKTVRGFYAKTGSNQTSLDRFDNPIIITVSADKVSDPVLGSIHTWVKRQFQIEGDVLKEKVFEVDRNHRWPLPLSECNDQFGWVQVGETQLTNSSELSSSNFQVTMIAPIVSDDFNSLKSPFLKLTYQVGYITPQAGRFAPPVTLTSTIVPTFSYGEVRDE